MSWTYGEYYNRKYREFLNSDNDMYREYQIDKEIAEHIKKKACNWCTARAISIAITGVECQYTGIELKRIAAWTLGENEHEFSG